MSSSDTIQKKRNNYKLLIDPELKKGQKKLYRLNGKDVPGFPPVGHPRDPRTQKTVLGLIGVSANLPVPRFKFDKFWEGKPPQRDVFVIGLNESVKSTLLKEVCDEIATVHSIKFHRHPKTKTFLGAATVSFQHSGTGLKAMKELDGKIVGGCYLRAELDDNGDQLKKYLEPVLKKCGLDKPRPRQPSKDSAAESEDSSHHNHPRTDSITEAVSESEGDAAQTATTSTASTPHTPPTLPPRKTSTSSSSSCDLFAPPIIHFPYSSLNLICFALSRTPSESSSGVPGLSSPSVHTPSSIDSGISLRHSSSSLRSPTVDSSKLKKSWSSSQPLPPLPPPEENAPPIPPPPQDPAMPPPPLPPLPPAPSEDGPTCRGGGILNDYGIENISSDEDEPSVAKPSLPQMRNGKISFNIKRKNVVSPVSSSPSHSPRISGTGKVMNGSALSPFDPTLGLDNLLAKARSLSLSLKSPLSSQSATRPSGTAPSNNSTVASSLIKSSVSSKAAITMNSTTAATSSGRNPSAKSSPYIGFSSPRPPNSAYELEVEEISGDESPVMVCFEPLKVETISDDDMELGDEDMEMCSDDDNAQDSVIEVHVKTSSSQNNILPPTSGPPVIGPRMPHPPLPPLPQEMRPNSGPHPPPLPPPIGYFPPPPPPGTTPFPPPPPPPHLPPLPPTNRADFEFVSPPHPARPPHMMLHPPPPHEPVRPHPYHNSPPPHFINDIPLSRLPNGYIGRHPPSRSFSKSKMLKGFSPPKNKRESISQDVLCKAMEQLRLILLNDVHKKIVENSAYPVLDSHWEKREKEKQSQKSEGSATTATTTTAASAGDAAAEKEKPSRSLEPYRRMLPGMNLKKEGEGERTDPSTGQDSKSGVGEDGEREEEGEGDEERPSLPTPRKRLMNFKIPLVRGAGERRDQQMSVVARRNLFREEPDDQSKPPPKPEPSLRNDHGFYSDISSSEDFTSASEGEEEEEGREGEGESSADEGEEEWDSEAESMAEKSSSSEDEEEAFNRIFASSDSESDFENFVAQNKQQKRRLSEPTGEELPTPAKAKPSKPKRGRRKVKAKEEAAPNVEDDERTPVIIAEEATKLMTGELEVDKENRNKEKIIVEEVKVVPKPPPPRRAQFKKRPIKSEEEVLTTFLEKGLDKEDVLMMKLAFVRLRGVEDEMVEGMHWAYYPHIPPSAPPPKRRRVTVMRDVDVEDHVTGCARSEGYYKIDMRDKVKYLPHHRDRPKDASQQKQKQNKSSGRVNRANQRKLASLFSAGDVSSDLAKYNQLKARKKHLKFAKSTIHNWGLFAMENIAADEMVIEYVGQMVRQAVADEREKRYEAAGIGSSYLFRVDHDYIIDATHQGNLARFINHCCDPNCYAKVINFGTLKKIVIYSKRDIAMGEEITYDYKFPIEDDKIPCLCGAPNCRGTLN